MIGWCLENTLKPPFLLSVLMYFALCKYRSPSCSFTIIGSGLILRLPWSSLTFHKASTQWSFGEHYVFVPPGLNLFVSIWTFYQLFSRFPVWCPIFSLLRKYPSLKDFIGVRFDTRDLDPDVQLNWVDVKSTPTNTMDNVALMELPTGIASSL